MFVSFLKDEDTYGKKNGQKQSYNSYLRVTFITKHSLSSTYLLSHSDLIRKHGIVHYLTTHIYVEVNLQNESFAN